MGRYCTLLPAVCKQLSGNIVRAVPNDHASGEVACASRSPAGMPTSDVMTQATSTGCKSGSMAGKGDKRWRQRECMVCHNCTGVVLVWPAVRRQVIRRHNGRIQYDDRAAILSATSAATGSLADRGRERSSSRIRVCRCGRPISASSGAFFRSLA